MRADDVCDCGHPRNEHRLWERRCNFFDCACDRFTDPVPPSRRLILPKELKRRKKLRRKKK